MMSGNRSTPVVRPKTRLFKGIICDVISEFESHMPSHAVRSLQWRSSACDTLTRLCVRHALCWFGVTRGFRQRPKRRLRA